MSVKLKYQGQQYSRTKNQKSIKYTYYGTQNQIDQFMNSLKFGSRDDEKGGYLTQIHKTQMQGIFFQVELTYTISYQNSSGDDSQTVVGVKSASLSVRNIQMPLQHHKNYRKNWNYYLYAVQGESLPVWWSTFDNEDDLTESEQKQYMWVKDPSEVPEKSVNGKAWKKLKNPIKMGVQYYDLACFVVSESAKYNSASSAGNAIEKNINSIKKPSNDFGLSGGNWKCSSCSVQFDGKFWIVTSEYTKSGDDKGWDTDLYS